MTLLEDPVWHERIHLDGWTAGSGGTSAVVEPATGQTLGAIGSATADDVTRAAARAAEAQREWARTSPAERAAVLRRAGDLFAEHAEEIKDWIVREAGSTRAKATVETDFAAAECYEDAALPAHPLGDVLSSGEPRWSFARQIGRAHV